MRFWIEGVQISEGPLYYDDVAVMVAASIPDISVCREYIYSLWSAY